MHELALADAIFHLRGRRTQKAFADEVGVTRQAIMRWEQGDTAGMRLAHAQRLAELGVARELLLDGPAPGSIVVSVAPFDTGNVSQIVAQSGDDAKADTRVVA